MREINTVDRYTWAVCDRSGVVADVTRLSARRWAVEDYHDGGVAYFRTRSQAFQFAMCL